MDTLILICTVLGTVTAVLAIMPVLGLDIRIWGRGQDGARLSGRRRGTFTILLALMSLVISAASFYYFYRPRTIERVVEKPAKVATAEPCQVLTAQPVKNPSSKLPHKELPRITEGQKPVLKEVVQVPQQSCPNGICNAGNNNGMQTVNNFTPPPPNFSFTEEVVSPLSDNAEKSVKIHIKPDRAVPGAIVGILFSAPIDPLQQGQDEPSLVGAGISQMNWSAPLVRGAMREPVPNSMGITINAPAVFVPGEELIVPVKSKSDVHVLQVVPIGAR